MKIQEITFCSHVKQVPQGEGELNIDVKHDRVEDLDTRQPLLQTPMWEGGGGSRAISHY